MSEVKDIERTSLDAHVSLCELRYQQLERRITEVEGKLDELKALLQDVHKNLARVQTQGLNRWDKAQAALIVVLVGIVSYLLPTFLRG